MKSLMYLMHQAFFMHVSQETSKNQIEERVVGRWQDYSVASVSSTC